MPATERVGGTTGAAYGGEIDYVALNEETEREYRKVLEKAVSQVSPGVSVTTRLGHGRPGDRILEQMEEGGHDLVVMGSRGRGNEAGGEGSTIDLQTGAALD